MFPVAMLLLKLNVKETTHLEKHAYFVCNHQPLIRNSNYLRYEIVVSLIVPKNHIIYKGSIFKNNFSKIYKDSIFPIEFSSFSGFPKQVVFFVQMRQKLTHGFENLLKNRVKKLIFAISLRKPQDFENSPASPSIGRTLKVFLRTKSLRRR